MMESMRCSLMRVEPWSTLFFFTPYQAAVHLCVSGGMPHILEQLADMDADLAAPDSGGATPAHYAAQVYVCVIFNAVTLNNL